jgi:hypothetical protein
MRPQASVDARAQKGIEDSASAESLENLLADSPPWSEQERNPRGDSHSPHSAAEAKENNNQITTVP